MPWHSYFTWRKTQRNRSSCSSQPTVKDATFCFFLLFELCGQRYICWFVTIQWQSCVKLINLLIVRSSFYEASFFLLIESLFSCIVSHRRVLSVTRKILKFYCLIQNKRWPPSVDVHEFVPLKSTHQQLQQSAGTPFLVSYNRCSWKKSILHSHYGATQQWIR